ncbi:MAG: class I SAM-dependent methyltransferase [Colwellia sp.]|nr:class I SAM-dependent methyltransferase [Colwellia sp.]
MRILNLYACLGGNRYKWGEVADIEVTAVEWDPELARLYQERFPNDKVIVADAHQYLLDHYKEYDFIWSSPPCPTHSRINISQYTRESWTPKYPDMKLYQEIIFLDNFYKGKYVVENVIPYYSLLVPGIERNRHVYWTNFKLPNIVSNRKNPDISRTKDLINVLSDFHDYDFHKYKGEQPKNKIARNLVDYEAGRTILETALGIIRKQNIDQTELNLI